MFLYADLLKARLVGNINNSTTSITVDDTSKLPVLGGGQYFIVRLIQDGNIEHLQCTAFVGNVLTVVRDTYYPYSFRDGALCVIGIDPYGYELTTGSSSGLTQAQVLARTSVGF